MKTPYAAIILAATAALVSAVELITPGEPRPLPEFVPSAPHADKALVDYTPSDVIGCISTARLPAGHKYDDGTQDEEGLKAGWPGAKVATSIDTLINIALGAPSGDEGMRHLESVFDNIAYILEKAMDVTDTAKADAIVRVVNAQTDATKVSRAKWFGFRMFPRLLDPRLLAYETARLDDATVIGDMVSERSDNTLRHRTVTARGVARNNILSHLEETLGMSVDEAPFRVADEAAACAALKTWLAAHQTEIAAQCAAKMADPNRVIPTPFVHTWDARE